MLKSNYCRNNTKLSFFRANINSLFEDMCKNIAMILYKYYEGKIQNCWQVCQIDKIYMYILQSSNYAQVSCYYLYSSYVAKLFTIFFLLNKTSMCYWLGFNLVDLNHWRDSFNWMLHVKNNSLKLNM